MRHGIPICSEPSTEYGIDIRLNALRLLSTPRFTLMVGLYSACDEEQRSGHPLTTGKVTGCGLWRGLVECHDVIRFQPDADFFTDCMIVVAGHQ